MATFTYRTTKLRFKNKIFSKNDFFFLYIIYCVQVCYWCKQFLKGVKKNQDILQKCTKVCAVKTKIGHFMLYVGESKISSYARLTVVFF